MRKLKNPLAHRARRGRTRFPAATVAYYGPDTSFASKVVVGIVQDEDNSVKELKKWFADGVDVRRDERLNEELKALIEARGVKTVVFSPGIIGCPHEEGVDYPRGQECPSCPFWHGRDRWTGEPL